MCYFGPSLIYLKKGSKDPRGCFTSGYQLFSLITRILESMPEAGKPWSPPAPP
ncbi:hypothetical protein D3OALGB2SA_2376 [Olavius algarvensis associated proteobacterium Delta 3]|nr:hypothetical protein D3OALGB2SA_2376 [Olavius algarvensis associated proteobacterium Delta 3]